MRTEKELFSLVTFNIHDLKHDRQAHCHIAKRILELCSQISKCENKSDALKEMDSLFSKWLPFCVEKMSVPEQEETYESAWETYIDKINLIPLQHRKYVRVEWYTDCDGDSYWILIFDKAGETYCV